MSGLCKLEMFAPAVRTHMRDIVNSLTLQLRSGRLSAGTDRNACVKPIPPSCKDWPNCPARERDSPGPKDDARAEPPGARPVRGLDRAACDPIQLESGSLGGHQRAQLDWSRGSRPSGSLTVTELPSVSRSEYTTTLVPPPRTWLGKRMPV